MSQSNGRPHADQILSPQLREKLARANYDAKLIREMTDQLADLPEAKGIIVLGGIVCTLPYHEGGPSGSGRVFQSAIKVPGGLGAVQWDSDELVGYEADPAGKLQLAWNKFVPFVDCLTAVRSKLVRHSGPLVTRLFGIIDGRT